MIRDQKFQNVLYTKCSQFYKMFQETPTRGFNFLFSLFMYIKNVPKTKKSKSNKENKQEKKGKANLEETKNR